MIVIKPNIQTKYRTFKRYKYRYGGAGIFQNIGRKLSKESVKTLIKSVSTKPKRKQEYTDIVNSLIQPTKPSNTSSLAGIISGSGIVYD